VDSLEEPLPLPQAPEEPPWPSLLAIVGPTAAGKSALALALAERWNGEIVNYDSVQLYRGFDIGAGKVPPSERRGVPHHLLDPAAAARIHARDQQKTLRAIEVCLLARQPMSGMLERGRTGLRGFNVIKIGLNPDRTRLRERIDRRVEGMFAAGLLDEARRAI